MKDTTLRVYNSAITTSAAPGRQPRRRPPSESEWTLRFGASAAGGQDPANYVGVCSAAGDGYDPIRDVPEPAVSSPVRVTLTHKDWGDKSGEYARDIRSAVGTGQEWDVAVSCSVADADVTLAWLDLNSTVPAGGQPGPA